MAAWFYVRNGDITAPHIQYNEYVQDFCILPTWRLLTDAGINTCASPTTRCWALTFRVKTSEWSQSKSKVCSEQVLVTWPLTYPMCQTPSKTQTNKRTKRQTDRRQESNITTIYNAHLHGESLQGDVIQSSLLVLRKQLVSGVRTREKMCLEHVYESWQCRCGTNVQWETVPGDQTSHTKCPVAELYSCPGYDKITTSSGT